MSPQIPCPPHVAAMRREEATFARTRRKRRDWRRRQAAERAIAYRNHGR